MWCNATRTIIGTLNHYHLSGGVWHYVTKALKTVIRSDPAIPLLGIYPKELIRYVKMYVLSVLKKIF